MDDLPSFAAVPWGDFWGAAWWCAGMWLLGFAIWRAVEPRPRALAPVVLFFPIGMAGAVLLAAVATPLVGGGGAFWLVWAAAVGGVLNEIRRRSEPRVGLQLRLADRPSSRLVFHASMFVSCVLALLALALCTKPIISYDLVSYHMPLAHRAAAGGWFTPDPGSFYSRLAQASPLLFAPVVSDWQGSFDDRAMRFVLWVAFVCSIGLAGRVAGHLGARPPARAVAGLLVAALPMVWRSLLNAHSDLLVLCLGLAAAERWLSADASGRWRWGIVAGALAGTAAAVKFSAVGILAVPLLLMAVAMGLAGGRLASRLRVAAALLLGLAVGLGPWIVRAVVVGGHPLYPFGGGDAMWTLEQSRFVVEQHRPVGILSAEHLEAMATRFGVLGYGVGGLSIPVLAGLLGLFSRRTARGGVLAVGALAGYGAWCLVGLNPDRFLLPVSALAIVAGVVACGVRGPNAVLRALAGVALLGAFLVSVQGDLGTARLAGIGVRSADAWVEGMVPTPSQYAAVRETVGEGRVLMLFDAQERLHGPNRIANTVWDQPAWAGDLRGAGNVREFVDALRERGVHWVWVNEFELGRLVDFYGGLEGESLMARTGVRDGGPRWMRALENFPPHRHGGLGEREIGILDEFLRLSRSQAVVTIPFTPVTEAWLSPLPAV